MTRPFFDGRVSLSNYETVGSQLYVAGPITDTISADIAWTGLHQNKGWGRNLTLNRENKLTDYGGVRSKIVARPVDAVKVTLAGDYFKTDENLFLAWRIAEGTVGTGGFASPGDHDTTANRPASNLNKVGGASLTAEADLGSIDLTSISAVRWSRNRSNFDVDGGPLDLVNIDAPVKSRTIQQELRLASRSAGSLSWQLGGFFYKSRVRAQQTQSGVAFAASGLRQIFIMSNLDTTSYAAFGEVTYDITPTTKVTGGLRYTSDKRAFDGGQTPTLLSGVNLATTAVDSTLKYNEITYRLALRQEISNAISVYVSVNRGFKAGAYSLQSPTSPPVEPQFIMAYEIGLKSELFDRRLRLNLAAYHYDIDDYQVRSAAAASPGASLLLNAATVTVDGFDAEFEAAPTERLRLFGGFTVLDSRYSAFGGAGAAFQAPIVYPNPATCPPALRGTDEPGVLGPGPRTGGFTTCFGDVSGNATPLAPDFAGSVGASYSLPIAQSGNLRFSTLYSYNSGYVFDPDNKAKQDSYGLLNASIELRPAKTYGFEVWVRNLTKTEYAVQLLTTGTGIAESQNAPRTYGIDFLMDF